MDHKAPDAQSQDVTLRHAVDDLVDAAVAFGSKYGHALCISGSPRSADEYSTREQVALGIAKDTLYKVIEESKRPRLIRRPKNSRVRS